MKGFYSEAQRPRTGVVVWAEADGREVRCTDVGDNPPLFNDVVVVSESLARFVRVEIEPEHGRRFILIHELPVMR